MKAKTILGAATSSAVLVMGLAGAMVGAQSGTIGTTGPNSHNTISQTMSSKVKVSNDNDLKFHNSNSQSAWTGKAEVEHNTTGGDATSGGASNANSLTGSVTIDNSGAGASFMQTGGGDWTGSITNTGPDSHNKVVIKSTDSVHITNDNNLSVMNYSTQTAKSGSAEVSGNTTGGSATSGDASNTNASTLTFNVTN